MIYLYKEKKEVLNQEKAKGYKLAETSLNELVHLELEPGGGVPEHALLIHVTFYVIKGEGNVTINGVTSLCKQGDVVTVAANDQRGWMNDSNTKLELLAIKQK